MSCCIFYIFLQFFNYFFYINFYIYIHVLIPILSKVIYTLNTCKGPLSFYNHYFSMLMFLHHLFFFNFYKRRLLLNMSFTDIFPPFFFSWPTQQSHYRNRRDNYPSSCVIIFHIISTTLSLPTIPLARRNGIELNQTLPHSFS